MNVDEKKPEGISVTTLGKTSANSWSERQLDQKQVTFDKDKDVAGPIPVAAVVTVEPKKEETPEKKEEEAKGAKPEEKKEETAPKKQGRLAVFGDSDFASNRYCSLSGNENLFLNTVNWLTEEADLISIQAKTSSPRTIHMTPAQGRMLFFISLVILPLIVLVAGILVWVRRHSL